MSVDLELIEITAYDPAIGGTRVLRYSNLGFTTGPTETPPNTYYAPRLKSAGNLRRTAFDDGRTTGASSIDVADAILNNEDGELDALADYGFDGLPVVRRLGVEGAAYPSGFTTVYTATQRAPQIDSSQIKLRIRSRQAELDTPLQDEKYAGDNVAPDGLEGTPLDIQGKPKPLLLGVGKGLTPRCVNPWKLIYQISSDPTESVQAVYDRGIALGLAENAVVSWQSRTNPAGVALYGIAFGSYNGTGRFVAAGSGGGTKVITSDDGNTWIDRGNQLANACNGICWGAGRFVAVGAGGMIEYSTDGGATFTAAATPSFGASAIRAVAYGNGKFVAVDGGKIASSTDANTWTQRTHPFTGAILVLAFGAGLFVAAGENGELATSVDGTTWSSLRAAAFGTDVIRAIVYADRFLIGGDNGRLSASIDGINWSGITSIAQFVGVADILTLAWTGAYYLAGGSPGGQLASSKDGVSWLVHTNPFGAGIVRGIAVGANTMVAISDGTGTGTIRSLPEPGTYASQADLLDDALQPLPGNYKYFAAGGHIRLGSAPIGQLTVDATQGATAADRTAAQVWSQILDRKGLSGADVSSSDITDLDSDNSAEIGYYAFDEMTAADALDEVAASVGAWWGVDRAGVFRIKRLEAGFLIPAEASYCRNDFINSSLERLPTGDDGEGLPAFKTILGYARNYTPQDGSSLAGGVSDDRRAEVALEWREAVAEDLTVQTKHPLAPQIRETSLIVAAADAATEVARRQTLRGTRRDRLRFAVELSAANAERDLGDVIEISATPTLDVLFSYQAGDDISRLGGVFSRASTAMYIDEYGVLRTAAANVSRGGHYVNGRRTLLLEDARTFRQTYSRDPGSWTATNVSLSNSHADARGAGGAWYMTATSVGGSVNRAVALIGDGTKAMQVILKKGSAAVSQFGLWSGAAWRHLVNVTWGASGGMPTLSTQAGAGTLFAPIPLTGGFWLLRASVNSVVVADGNAVYVYPDATGTGTAYIDGFYVEDASFCSMPMDTTSVAVTRAADSLYFAYTPLPQAQTVYARIVEGGTGQILTGARYWQITAAVQTTPMFLAYASAGSPTTYHHNGSAAVASASAITPSIGDLLEIRSVLYGDGSVLGAGAVAGAAEVLGTQSGADTLAGAWSAERLYLNSGGATDTGFAAFDQLVIMKGGKSLAEMRDKNFTRGRFGLAAPRKFVILGVAPEALKRRVSLDVWG